MFINFKTQISQKKNLSTRYKSFNRLRHNTFLLLIYFLIQTSSPNIIQNKEDTHKKT